MATGNDDEDLDAQRALARRMIAAYEQMAVAAAADEPSPPLFHCPTCGAEEKWVSGRKEGEVGVHVFQCCADAGHPPSQRRLTPVSVPQPEADAPRCPVCGAAQGWVGCRGTEYGTVHDFACSVDASHDKTHRFLFWPDTKVH